MTSVQVQVYSRSWVQSNAMQSSRLIFLLCFQLHVDEARAHDHLANLGFRPAKEHIDRLLLELFTRVQNRLPNQRGETIPLPLAQTDLAYTVGFTGIHVNRTLRKQRIVWLRNQKLEVMDPVSFARAAGVIADVSSF